MEKCFEFEKGFGKLLPAGLVALGNRLDTASRLKEAYEEDIDQELSQAAALRRWRAAWDEERGDIDSPPPQNVKAMVDNWPATTFVDQAQEGDLILNPSYQRDSVWSLSESRSLIDSVLRGIPLPSIILHQRKGENSYEIVDGKQRLTAILRFVGRHPDALRFGEAKSLEAEVEFKLFGEDFRAWRNRIKKKIGLSAKDETENFLPFTYALPAQASSNDPLDSLSRQYYCEIRNKPVTIQGNQETIRKLFRSGASLYKVPVIVYKDTDIRQIHRVFGLYNRQGKKLNATEVRNAIYHHLKLTRLLLFLSGDNEDKKSLAQYLGSEEINSKQIPELLKGLGVSHSRFNRTKLISWVAALILQGPERRSTGLSLPGSTKLIESMLKDISDDPRHSVSSEGACKNLAFWLQTGAEQFEEIQGMCAVYPSFTNTNRGLAGVKWLDPPAIVVWTACTLASMAGVKASITTRDAIEKVTRETEPLEKQQARSQWIYIAKTILALLDALEVDLADLSAILKGDFDYDCLATFAEVAALDDALKQTN